MFESIFTSSADSSIDIGAAAAALLVAVVFGLIISIIYMFAYKKDGYNRNFVIGLVLLPAIVSVVIFLIGSNVARAFSMAGAFALVRFRSAPGSAKDIAVVFFAMATGLACGLGYLVFAALFVVVILLVLVVLSLTNFAQTGDNVKLLKIVIPENLNYSNVFDEVFTKFTSQSKLRKVKTTNMGTMYELVYNVSLKKDADEKSFIDALRVRNGNLNITLGMLTDDDTVL